MKKIIIAIVVFVLVLAFSTPIFADTSTAQGNVKISVLAQNENGTGLSDWIVMKKEQTSIAGGELTKTYDTSEMNLGQFLQLWKAKWGFKDLKE